MKAMLLTKLKISTVLVLSVGLVGTGVILTQPAFRAGQPNGEQRNLQSNLQARTTEKPRSEAQADAIQGGTPKPEAKKTDPPKTERAALQEGTWQLVSVERNGMDVRVDEADLRQLYVERDKVIRLLVKQENERRTYFYVTTSYKLHPTKKPTAIDLLIPSPGLVREGKTVQIDLLLLMTLREIYCLNYALIRLDH